MMGAAGATGPLTVECMGVMEVFDLLFPGER
jgi:hypothetical protein